MDLFLRVGQDGRGGESVCRDTHIEQLEVSILFTYCKVAYKHFQEVVQVVQDMGFYSIEYR